jgi:hypothetical protein
MYLTEELLTEWTGLKGRELSIFYLMYKKHASSKLLHNDLEYIKQDIIKFKDNVWCTKCHDDSIKKDTQIVEQAKESKVTSLIKFWESKIIR